ncbi:hypothetical protein M0Q50_03425 [bacterium]|jgi:hypothetical protein|nr:hypothetical protein [bacterium]
MLFKKGDIVKIQKQRHYQYWYHEEEMVVLDYTEYTGNSDRRSQCIVNYEFKHSGNLIQDVLLDYVDNIYNRRLKKLKSL